VSNDSILYRSADHLAYLTLNRPEQGNEFDLPMAQALVEVCAAINAQPDVHAVILTGAGPAFCTGGDERLLAEMTASGVLASTQAEAIAGIACPTLAVLNGDALGLGLELVLACDIRLAADTARVGLPQIVSGLIPLDGGTQRLARVAGRAVALDMILTGSVLNGGEACAAGILNQVVPLSDLSAQSQSFAQNIAAKAPFALRYCKEAVQKGLDMTLEQGLRLEADLYFLLHTTADRTEGIRSFREKRPPKYKGE
jgi:enoyl-CoA hydratase/carnithine racemase